MVWDNYQKLMMPFDVFATAHYKEIILRINADYFLLKHCWIALSEREGDLVLLTGIWTYKPSSLS